MFHKLGVPVLGIVENMSVLPVPGLRPRRARVRRGGGRRTAEELGVPFLGRSRSTRRSSRAATTGGRWCSSGRSRQSRSPSPPGARRSSSARGLSGRVRRRRRRRLSSPVQRTESGLLVVADVDRRPALVGAEHHGHLAVAPSSLPLTTPPSSPRLRVRVHADREAGSLELRSVELRPPAPTRSVTLSWKPPLAGRRCSTTCGLAWTSAPGYTGTQDGRLGRRLDPVSASTPPRPRSPDRPHPSAPVASIVTSPSAVVNPSRPP